VRSASQIYRVTQRLVARSRRACPERGRGNPEGAYPTHAVRLFNRRGPQPGAPSQSFPGPRTRTGSILQYPAATPTFSVAIQARFTLASPATCIRASCNIRRARWKVSLRTMAASACSILRAMRTFAQPSLGKTTQKLAARKEAQAHSHDQFRVQGPCTDLGMEDDYRA
jgi:hypothetical protein